MQHRELEVRGPGAAVWWHKGPQEAGYGVALVICQWLAPGLVAPPQTWGWGRRGQWADTGTAEKAPGECWLNWGCHGCQRFKVASRLSSPQEPPLPAGTGASTSKKTLCQVVATCLSS